MASVSNLWCTRLTNDLVNHFAHVAVRNVCFIKPFTQFKEPIKWLHKYSFLSCVDVAYFSLNEKGVFFFSQRQVIIGFSGREVFLYRTFYWTNN